MLQGLTEFLPVSSSAHLRIAPALAGRPDPGAAFTAVVQLGTLAAELAYFRGDLYRVGTSWWRGVVRRAPAAAPDVRLGWALIIATLPIGVAGLAFRTAIHEQARSLTLIACALIALGVLLAVADRLGRTERGLDDLDLRTSIVLGSAQALALIPGVSRSGATLTAARILGFDRASAARASFLLSIPAVSLAGALETAELASGTAASGASATQLLLASGAAGVVGYAAIAGLLRFLTSHSLVGFAVYRVVLGVMVLLLLLAGAIE